MTVRIDTNQIERVVTSSSETISVHRTSRSTVLLSDRGPRGLKGDKGDKGDPGSLEQDTIDFTLLLANAMV